MNIKFTKTTSMYLSIIGYEFPDMDEAGYEEEMNLLSILIKVNSDGKKWSLSGSFLLTWEVKQIIEWLENIENNIAEGKAELSFKEDELIIRQLEAPKGKYRIQFELFGAKIPPHPKSRMKQEDYIITGNFTPLKVKKMAEGFRNASAEYPIRNEKDKYLWRYNASVYY